MSPRRFLIAAFLPLVLFRGLSAAAAENPAGAAFRHRIMADLEKSVPPIRAADAAARAAGRLPEEFYFPYVLWAEIELHAATGEARYLAWAKEDVMRIVRASIGPDGKAKPFFKDFRFMAPFCDAYLRIKDRGLLTAAEIAQVQAQIAASMAAHQRFTDFGAQNRGLIYGSEYLYAARAVPGAPSAARWRDYGRALIDDSLHGWDVEDSSNYEPFWFCYGLALTETLGTGVDRMRSPFAHFYLEKVRQLLMPNGLLPDWGDAEWGSSWNWDVANLVRGGSVYRDGEYVEAARRIYEANLARHDPIEAESIGGIALALRWLDPSVAPVPFTQVKSQEVVDDLVSKKIVFRSAAGAYALLNYRDEGPYGRFTRDYLDSELSAFEEKPHHGHADENSFCLLMDHGTVLLDDGGYRTNFKTGWRADVFHNRVVARTGFPITGDLFRYLLEDTSYHAVATSLIEFGTFGSLDYSRTRLVDDERGYTGDRIVLFAPGTGLYIVVDSLLIDREGNKVFCNTWYPDSILSRGDNYVVSWPRRIAVRTGGWAANGDVSKDFWTNPHRSDLLIQFLGDRDKIAGSAVVPRRYVPSSVFYQYLRNHFFKGQRLTFVTVLRPHPAGTFSPEMLRDVRLAADAHDDGRTLGLRFTLEGDPVAVGLKLDRTIGLTNLRGRPLFSYDTGAVAYGPLRTDADFAFVRERRGGSREFGFMYGIGVEYGGRTLFKMPTDPAMYQGPGDFRAEDVRDKMPRWHGTVTASAGGRDRTAPGRPGAVPAIAE